MRAARRPFSAALCRGLIEATHVAGSIELHSGGFPRLYAAASLKPRRLVQTPAVAERVFRGFMPRPH